ncbi:YegP family protein [Pseudodesulfovibrio sp.]|uniref:YegP family protein n=1 Tax=Pseudodesulfovibrio sp. TaxID=2035812 RepID=UPI002616285A|nr:YegP family protein [Pseudodesulfovibrio sp.]MDD3313197.1 YegP family protein [Pseudodesulfovibrio sp.]
MAAKFEIKKTANGQFMFNLKASNGQIILTSERYAAKQGAKNGISSVQTNCPYDERYDRRTSRADEPYFVLKAGNGEIIGNSEMYSGVSARENGIESVKANGTTQNIEDLT